MTDAGSPLADALTIRAATPADLDRISDIINDPPNPKSLSVAGTAERAIRGGRVLVHAGISLHLPMTVVAEIDGSVAAIMDAGAHHPEIQIGAALFLRLLPPVVRTIGPLGLWRLLRSRPANARVNFPADPDSYYIAELDVDAAHRNRGIGGVLLDHAESQARAAGCPRMTLVTDIINPARHLYERHGFRAAAEKRDPAFERLSGSPGRVWMVKDLA
jgi:ribosomal protein S18 acetylase RimI-like enzyme